jgi:hypothetical protein
VARIYREHPDSSYLLAPRIFTRVFCHTGQLIPTVRFYEQLTQERLDMDMDIPEAGLHVVAVGSFLILELDIEQHELASQTTVTVLTPISTRRSRDSSPPAPRSSKSGGTRRLVRAPDCAILTV